MLWTAQSMWLPDPGGWMTSWVRKDRGNCLLSHESWVACHQCRCNYRRLSALLVILTSQALLSCSHVHCLAPSRHCSADPVSLYCIWRWPRLLILMTLTEASTECHGTDVHHGWFHTQALRSAVIGPSYLLSAICLSRKQLWNLKPCSVQCRRRGHFREAQSADCLI